jgi:pimeloyl-ACP methyl ester carboxylesterase
MMARAKRGVDMPKAQVNGIEIAYETFGEGEPVLLIMGIGGQMVMWDEQFCRDLAARGFQVTRFDNRDVGESTRLEHLRALRMNEVLKRRLLGQPVGEAYTLYDMADDAAALIRALGHESAHVVGMSLGGMVAQCLAIKHPERVRSLNLIMTTPGELWATIPTRRGYVALSEKPGKTRDQAIERALRMFGRIGGTRHNSPASLIAKMAGLQFDRGSYPPGFARQYAAVVAAEGRLRRLAKLRVPTLVVHGSEDPLVRPIGGRLIAAAIPGARFELIEGMGHDLGPSIWPYLIDGIVANSRRSRANLPQKPSLEPLWTRPISVSAEPRGTGAQPSVPASA